MGEQKISTEQSEHDLRVFTRAVLNDLEALDYMFKNDMMEEGVRRIGAEQEIFLVDSAMRPAPLAMEILESAKDGRLTTEIGKYNLEANLTPRTFSGDCLSLMEREINDVLNVVRKNARKFGGDVVLTGILPTLQPSDLVHENLTPKPRYYELDRVLTKLCGGTRHIYIKGLDELQIVQHNALIETCNTSFQVHLQVGISEFVKYYNWAQAISGPVLAPAVNSPVLFGHRLWNETRLALFRHAVDTRSETHQARSQPARVSFGNAWVKDSMLEVFREDVARFRIIMTQELEEDSLEMLSRGGIPALRAWRLHNGTIWRWNRACYGRLGDKPGLRIEARFLPAGPTVIDEMANTAFFLGLMIALPDEYDDVAKRMPFDDAKNNFFTAARYGLKSHMMWLDGENWQTQKLILEQLLPRARRGLSKVGVAAADVDRYLGVLEERVKAEATGSQWALDSLANMDPVAKSNVRMRTLTAAMKKNQEEDKPIHEWELSVIPQKSEWIDNYRIVEQFMSKDLFTVRPEDVVDLAASLMNWKHIRHVPVEDDAGNLVGIISHRDLINLLVGERFSSEIVVRDVMKTDLITIGPDTPTLVALYLMRERNIGCLPVISDNKLVGLITAHDFLTVSTRLFEERLKAQNP